VVVARLRQMTNALDARVTDAVRQNLVAVVTMRQPLAALFARPLIFPLI